MNNQNSKLINWTFDTDIRTNKGSDKLLTNVLKAGGLFGFIKLLIMPIKYNIFFIITWCLCSIIFLILIGLTDIRFFRNDKKNIEWWSW